MVFRRYDVDSGARLAEHISAAGDTGRGSMLFDSRSGHFFADAHDAVLVIDGVTLEAIARINSPIPGAAARFVLDPDRPAMYVIWTAVRSTGGYQHRIALIDSTTFATLAEADLPTDSGVVGLVLGPRPPRATNLSAVLGISVMLQWENEASRSLATGVIVEAGATPGATNLAWFWIQQAGEAERESIEKLKPELLLPLSLNEKLVGIISLGPKQSEEPFTRTDIRLLDSVATQTGLALKTAASRRKLRRKLRSGNVSIANWKSLVKFRSGCFPKKHPRYRASRSPGTAAPHWV